MYLNFFGLREQPFGVTPDPRFLYLSEAHKEALASLYYGIEANRGFIGLIAPPGMGKTTMLFHMLETFRTSARIAFLFQTHCNSREFMRLLLAELGCEDVLVLAGGNAAWCGAGLTPASGPTHLLSPRDDLWLASSERPGDARANIMAYLDWETSLLASMERGGCVPFRNVLWH